jgi:hypothetical protein
MSRAFEILILAGSQAPKKRREAGRAHQNGGGGEKDQDVHGRIVCTRKALSVTRSDDPDMAAAAISGVNKPAAASGAARTL